MGPLTLRVSIGSVGLVGILVSSAVVTRTVDDPEAAARLLAGSPAEFQAYCQGAIDGARADIRQLKTAAATDAPLTVLSRYDSAMGALGDAAARSSLGRNVHPLEAMRSAAEQCEALVDAAQTEISLDRDVYRALAAINADAFDPASRFYLDKTLRDFRRAGVDKDEPARMRIKSLREELVKLGQQFGGNIRSDVRSIELDPAALDGLPDDYRRAHAPGPSGKVTITTNNTDYVPFMTYAKNASAREALWRTYRQRGHPRNLAVLAGMLEKRKELAGLLGYADWADYITGDKMIGSRDNAAQFINRIAAAADRRAQADYAELLARKRADQPDAAAVNPWDAAHLDEQVKAQKHGFDSQTVRPYFEYGRVKQGLMDLTSRMFGLTYRRVANAPVWHEDVEVYDIFEADKRLGRIFLDMHPRENKYKHYAQFTLTIGRAGTALPEGVLVCNFPRPGSEPALMQHGDVETFFHEWGHLMHHVLGGHTRWAGISGVATEWDFVEAPSQMLEEWVWDAPTLQTFARHYETGTPISTDLVTRMRAADEFGKGLYVRQQMFYAATSLELHSRNPQGLDTTGVVAELQEKYTPYRFVPGTYFQESFEHLDGYSAIYYTYMWSLVIAKDLFTVFKDQGLLSPDVASRYRRLILEAGGSKPASDLVSDFLGRPYGFAAYEAWLNAN